MIDKENLDNLPRQAALEIVIYLWSKHNLKMQDFMDEVKTLRKERREKLSKPKPTLYTAEGMPMRPGK